MKRNWLLALLILAVLLDLTLTFAQYYQLPLDGDLAAIVVPRADYAPVLHDPFGWTVLTTGGWYSATNRFFAHLTMRGYCLYTPLLLQAFLSPIDSVYAAMALFNTGMQALLLYVLGWYATGVRRLGSWRLWLAMALMAPFFQTTGYNGQMSVVDNPPTYTFFYALPLLLLLLLLWPLYWAASQGQPVRLSALQLVALLALAVVLAFNSSVVGGTAMVLLLGMGLHLARQRWHRPASQWLRGLSWQAVLVYGLLGVLCFYSFYIGRHNTENITTTTVSVAERYRLVPYGIFDELTSKIGLPLLVLGCLANWQLIRRLLPPTPQGQRIGRVLRWLGGFTLVFVLLLPLGGYRDYRPLILRHDSILPITVGLIGFYALSAVYLLQHLPGRAGRWYVGGVLVMGFIFTNADRRLHPLNNNACERRSLSLLARAGNAPVVKLPEKCTVMSWKPITDPSESLTNAELLEYWGVTKGHKLYYYPAR